ncbi:MAG: hypothetical protein JW913_01125 [Chitinispirillaceae bacterium]|nr:hypothetical protein [Chitinispirillaceae bacterium]
MKKNLLFPVSAMAVALLTGVMRCTTGPTAGTETGNPDITACLDAALTMFDSADAWLPSAYLVEGERQLNPEKVYAAPSEVILAKRAAAAAADSSAPADTGISVIADTIVICDTVFINDTIVMDTAVQDTAVENIDEDSAVSVLVSRHIRYDSIFLIDTLLKCDTFFLIQTDSMAPVTSGSSQKSNYRVDTIKESTVLDYIVVRDSLIGTVTLFEVPMIDSVSFDTYRKASNAFVRSDSASTMVERQLTIGGLFISEVYYDGDGDGFLATSASGTVASAGGTITYRRETMETILQVDFDAGADNRFTTTADNRIHALQRLQTTAAGGSDRVRYGASYFGRTGDTIILQRDESLPGHDSIAHRSSRYACVAGIDSLDHRKNRCRVSSSRIDFRSGGIIKMEIVVVPAVPLSAGQSPATATLRALVDYGKGLTGMVEASIDYGAETIDGIYAEAGVEYHLTYHRNGTMPELLPLQ